MTGVSIFLLLFIIIELGNYFEAKYLLVQMDQGKDISGKKKLHALDNLSIIFFKKCTD